MNLGPEGGVVRRTRSVLPFLLTGRNTTTISAEQQPVPAGCVQAKKGALCREGDTTAPGRDNGQGGASPATEGGTQSSAKGTCGEKTVAGGRLSYGKMIGQALPFLWPDGWALRLRMVLCACALVFSRICNMLIPLCYKGAIDALSNAPSFGHGRETAPTSAVPSESFDLLFRYWYTSAGANERPDNDEGKQAVLDTWNKVCFYVVGYVCLKGYVGVQADVRNLIFTPVSQFTRKRSQLCVLNHLHSLSNSYHAGRKTGTVLHVVERGSASLQTLLSLVAFHVVPAVLDIILCTAVFIYSGHKLLAAVTGCTMIIYLAITAVVTDWRTKFRKQTLALEVRSRVKLSMKD